MSRYNFLVVEVLVKFTNAMIYKKLITLLLKLIVFNQQKAHNIEMNSSSMFNVK